MGMLFILGSAVVTSLVAIVGIIVSIWSQRQNAQDRRRDAGSELIANAQELRNIIIDLRKRHDSRLVRLVHVAPIPPDLERRYIDTRMPLIQARSKLILYRKSKPVRQALQGFLEANDAYAKVLDKLLRTVLIEKGDPKELARLEADMEAKLTALIVAVSHFVGEPIATSQSRVK